MPWNEGQMNETILPVTLEPLEEGGFLATSTVLPGLIAQGRTVAETLEIARDVARKLIDSYLDHGDPLPSGLTSRLDTAVEVGIPVGLP